MWIAIGIVNTNEVNPDFFDNYPMNHSFWSTMFKSKMAASDSVVNKCYWESTSYKMLIYTNNSFI